MALRAAVSETRCAAKAVLFRAPLNPTPPPDPQATTLPSGSVSETIVLLNVAVMNTLPRGTNFRSLRRVLVLLALAKMILRPSYFFITRRLPATVLRPLRFVRAFVFVR